MSKYLYNAIKEQNEITLSKEEQQERIAKINKEFMVLQAFMLQDPGFRSYLYSLKNNTSAISKLGNDFNSSKKGLQVKIVERINNCFNSALLAEEGGNVLEAATHLAIANLSRALFYKNVDKTTYPGVKEQYAKVIGLKHSLLESMYKMVSSLAWKRVNLLSGQVYEYGDAFGDGVEAVMYAMDTFDPNSTTKFSTYAFVVIMNYISKGVSGNTRTVKVPRHLQTKWRIVQTAMEKFNTIEEIHEHCNTAQTKLKFTEEEIFKLIAAFATRTVPLEAAEYETEDGDFHKIDLSLLKEKLTAMLYDRLPGLEADLMKMKYLERKKGKEMLNLLREKHSTESLYTSRLTELENKAIGILRTDPEFIKMFKEVCQ